MDTWQKQLPFAFLVFTRRSNFESFLENLSGRPAVDAKSSSPKLGAMQYLRSRLFFEKRSRYTATQTVAKDL